MIKKIRKYGVGKCFLILLALASTVLLFFYLFYCTIPLFNSDMATRLLCASEQMRTGQLFPDGWYNTTGLCVGLWEVMLIPFMSVIPDWILCRELVVVIQIIILLVCLVAFPKTLCKNWKTVSILSILFMCLPFVTYDEIIYEAAYVPLVFYSLIVNICVFRILDSQKKNTTIYYILLAVTIFLAGYSSIRNFALIMLPAVLSIVLYYWLEYRTACIAECIRQKAHKPLLAICVFTLLTFFAYRYLSILSPSYTDFRSSSEVGTNLGKFIDAVFTFFKASDNAPLLSISSIQNAVNFVFMIVTACIAPIYFLINYRKLENRALKMYTIFAWVSDFVIIYMMIFYIGCAPRYYTTIYFHNIIFLGVLLVKLLKKAQKDLKGILWVSLLALLCINHLNYFQTTVAYADSFYEEEQTGTLVEFLEENDLKWGVASYWNAYEHMARSNGDLVIVACFWVNQDEKILDPAFQYDWGCSEYWFTPENYPGRSFLLMEEGETVSEAYYELASDVKMFKRYTILIFDQNLYSYDLMFSE